MENSMLPLGKYFTVDELFIIANQPNKATEMTKGIKPTFFGTHSLRGIYPDRSVAIEYVRHATEESDLVILPSHLTKKTDLFSESKEAISAKGQQGKAKRKFFVSDVTCKGQSELFEELLAELSVRPTVIKSISINAEEGLEIEKLKITTQNQSFFNDNAVQEFLCSEILTPDISPVYKFDLTSQDAVITPTNEIKFFGLGTANKLSVLIEFAESYAILD